MVLPAEGICPFCGRKAALSDSLTEEECRALHGAQLALFDDHIPGELTEEDLKRLGIEDRGISQEAIEDIRAIEENIRLASLQGNLVFSD